MSVKIEKGMTGSGISMTSFMDIVFQLLIFFLVAAKFEEAEREIKIKPPTASESSKPVTARPNELVVNITREGTFTVKLKTVTSKQLLELLRQSAADNPGQQVTIRGDRGSQLQATVDVMDMCKKANLPFNIATEGDSS